MEDRRVSPLEVDGVKTATVGTAVWVVVLAVTLAYRSQLEADGHGWWVWTALTGLVLGLVGVGFLRLRRSRQSKARSARS